MLAAGFVIALNLPFPPPLKALTALAWLAIEGRQFMLWSAAAGRLERVSFSDACTRGLFENAIWRRLEAAPGSVVTAGHAWLRLRDESGQVFCVLLARRRMPAAAWRRLTVCWRLQA